MPQLSRLGRRFQEQEMLKDVFVMKERRKVHGKVPTACDDLGLGSTWKGTDRHTGLG